MPYTLNVFTGEFDYYQTVDIPLINEEIALENGVLMVDEAGNQLIIETEA
jgi:hypothetical protein